MLFNVITWNVDPEIFALGPFSIRYYGLFFAISFYLGYKMIEKMFQVEKVPIEWVEKLFVYVVVATVVGARFGHVFFYGWDYYSQNPGEILKVWHGGLASHGGAIGIVVAILIFSKKVSKRSPIWVLDRLVVPVALAAFFIRMGNLMNSEIIGVASDLPWAIKFLRASVADPQTPRHPAQVYEALSYLVIFAGIFYAYWKTNASQKRGLLFGIFLVGVFTARFFIEFVKENQEAFEEGMSLNMGQLLSIPFVLAGLYFIFKSLKK
ncbi:prolipoprotein diacylglyceryl transferase [Marinilabiliaceae bacterium JC017]|nr:prolipoprotein diacylglyceryl transferase [Marinilabiliaceae bacterium JC017]